MKMNPLFLLSLSAEERAEMNKAVERPPSLLAPIVAVLVFACQVLGQATPPSLPATPDAFVKSWAFNLTVEGYFIPHETSYANPDFMADRVLRFGLRQSKPCARLKSRPINVPK